MLLFYSSKSTYVVRLSSDWLDLSTGGVSWAGEYHVCPESRGRQSCAGSVSSVMKPPLQWGTLTDLQIVTTTSHLTQLDITMDCIFHFPTFGETDN